LFNERKVYDYLKANPKTTANQLKEKFTEPITPLTNLRLKELVIIDRIKENNRLVNGYSVLE
jgi:hypothetical protein